MTRHHNQTITDCAHLLCGQQPTEVRGATRGEVAVRDGLEAVLRGNQATGQSNSHAINPSTIRQSVMRQSGSCGRDAAAYGRQQSVTRQSSNQLSSNQ
eukprot:2496739-Prymnesium_polylepis.1